MIEHCLGDKEKFSVSCVIHSIENGRPQGNIYIYVQGVRFGQDEFEEDLLDFFGRVRDEYYFNLENKNFDFQNSYSDLFQMNSEEFYHFYLVAREFEEDEGAKNILSKLDVDKFDSGVIFRAEYAFDHDFIAIISDGEKEKVFINDGIRYMECEQDSGKFYQFFLNLGKVLESRDNPDQL